MNLEHYLTTHHQGTPRQIFRLLRQGRVTVNETVADSGRQSVTADDEVAVDGLAVTGRQPQYLMLNKPVGVVNDLRATVAHSVGSLLNVLDQERSLQVLADLPKEVAGLVLLSDDAHFLADVQAAHWSSTLEVRVTGTALQDTDLKTLAACQQAQLVTHDLQRYQVVTVQTHQVAVAATALLGLANVSGAVVRTAIGPLQLPVDLSTGTYRGLFESEIDAVMVPTGDTVL